MRELSIACLPPLLMLLGCTSTSGNWYESSFYLLHEDHHTVDRFEVGHGNHIVPAGFTRRVFDLVLPPARRNLTTTAPEHVELVLRKKGDAYLLHLVNMAPGQREVNQAGRRQLITIADIPPAPPCHVSVRLPARPSLVHLEPSGVRVEDWHFDDGRLELDVPAFEIHQMVVMQVGGQD